MSRRRRIVATLVVVVAAMALAGLAAAYYLTYEPSAQIGITWRPGLSESRRRQLERQFLLVNPQPDGIKLRYDLLDIRPGNIAAIVREPDVADTDDVNRDDFTLPLTYRYGTNCMWIGDRVPLLRERGAVPTVVGTCVLALALGIVALARFGRSAGR